MFLIQMSIIDFDATHAQWFGTIPVFCTLHVAKEISN